MKRISSTQHLGTAGAALLTALLLIGCTWVEIAILDVPGVNRPYTILYLIPVAVGAAFLGIRGGILSALAALCLARLYLFTDNKHGLALVSFPHVAEAIEFGALLLGTLAIAVITGRLRSTLGSLNRTNGRLEEANRRLVESEEQRRVFNRDVLLAVTGGKLRLVEAGDMPPPALAAQRPQFVQALREPPDATVLRHALMKVGETTGLNLERIGDLCTATTEAATNAIKHGNGGQATVWADDDAVTVQIEDHGGGIAPAHQYTQEVLPDFTATLFGAAPATGGVGVGQFSAVGPANNVIATTTIYAAAVPEPGAFAAFGAAALALLPYVRRRRASSQVG